MKSHVEHFFEKYSRNTNSPDDFNLNANLYIIKELIKSGYISLNNFNFIPIDELKKINPFLYFSQANLMYLNFDNDDEKKFAEIVENYLANIRSSPKSIEENENLNKPYLTQFANVKTYGKNIPSSYYTGLRTNLLTLANGSPKKRGQKLLDASKIKNGHQDREDQKHILTYYGYRNTDNLTWPIDKISDHLYASLGPNHFVIPEQQRHPNGDLNVINFFLEVFDFHQRNLNIQTIIALGNQREDFLAYFDPDSPLEDFPIHIDHVVYKLKVKSEQLPKAFEIANEEKFQEYELTLILEEQREDKENAKIITKKVRLMNFAIPDMVPIPFTDRLLVYTHDQLLQSMQQDEAILVHCRAGLGRTGQLIAQLYLLYSDELDKIFANDNEEFILQELNKFVTSLREKRPGLLLTSEQVFDAFYNAYRYKKLKPEVRLEEREVSAPEIQVDNSTHAETQREESDRQAAIEPQQSHMENVTTSKKRSFSIFSLLNDREDEKEQKKPMIQTKDSSSHRGNK